MKMVSLFVLVMIISVGLNAEKIKFDLTKYKAPEIERKSLDLNFDLTNDYSKSDIFQLKVESTSDSLNMVDDEDYNQNFNSKITNYLKFYFKPDFSYISSKSLSELDFSLSFNNNTQFNNYEYNTSSDNIYFELNEDGISNLIESERYSKSERDDFSKRFDNKLRFDYNRSHYSSEKGFYYGYGGLLDAEFKYYNDNELYLRESTSKRYYYEEENYTTFSEQFDKEDSEKTEKTYTITFNPSITLGYGKIEYVHDARLAVYIFQSLEDHNLLKSIPDDNLIIELATLITKIKNERFIDKREQAIYEIENLMNFLMSKKIVTDDIAKISALVHDNWQFLRKSYISKPKYSTEAYSAISYIREKDNIVWYYQRIYPSINYSKNNERSYGNKTFISTFLLFEKLFFNSETKDVYDRTSNNINSSYTSNDSTFKVSDFEENDYIEQLGFAIQLANNYSKPLGLDWQLNIGNSFSFIYRDIKHEIEEDEYTTIHEYRYHEYDPDNLSITDTTYVVINSERYNYSDEIKNLEVHLSYEISYAFNFRTTFTGLLNGTYYTESKALKNLLHLDAENISDRTDIGISCKYYFSPKLSLSGLISYSYSFNKSFQAVIGYIYLGENTESSYRINEKRSSFRFELGFDYSIF
ncbi:MAG: hypothetical protein K8S23_11085 [Candidatus Cloacimonetes bacterium]|nr:hypothetical protein [Candidatus Cloacimonadota bacterium]